ncbi:Hypothetical predicted protein [Paramuricea clavata]|uniref:Uncharacterized protein n=1 Tax=Paramuricea clavata TaxID=317549 RepID=A0A7D9J0B2_PARCT|nr:Hypothetical predicted protein [Paramuricea clavata]
MDDSSPDINKLELNKLKWSTTNFTVSEFLKKFKLPQVVKVTSGFYGENDESTLDEDQVLCLHSVKSIRKLHGRDSSGKDAISIALDCQKKIEVSPSNLKDVYENVEELCSAFPSYVRISQGELIAYHFIVVLQQNGVYACKTATS